MTHLFILCYKYKTDPTVCKTASHASIHDADNRIYKTSSTQLHIQNKLLQTVEY